MKITLSVVTTICIVLFTSALTLAEKTPELTPASDSAAPSTCNQDQNNHSCMKGDRPSMMEGHQGMTGNHTNRMEHGCQSKNQPIDNNGHNQNSQDSISK